MKNEVLYEAILALKEATELGFASQSKRADLMDARFDRVDTRLGRLETRVEALEESSRAVRSDIADLKRRAR